MTHDFNYFPADKFYDIWTQQRQSVSPCKLSEQNVKNFTMRVRFFPKTQKLLTKYPGLATLSRHNYTMITYRRNSLLSTKWSLYGMSSYHFTVGTWNQLKLSPLGCTLHTSSPPKLASSVIAYYRIVTVTSVTRTQPITIDYRVTWYYASSNAVSKTACFTVRTHFRRRSCWLKFCFTFISVKI